MEQEPDGQRSPAVPAAAESPGPQVGRAAVPGGGLGPRERPSPEGRGCRHAASGGAESEQLVGAGNEDVQDWSGGRAPHRGPRNAGGGIGAVGRGCGRGELGGLRLRADNEADGPGHLGEPSVEARGIRGPVSPGIASSREGREARHEGFVRSEVDRANLWSASGPIGWYMECPTGKGRPRVCSLLVTDFICLVCRLTGTVEKLPRKRKSR